MIARVTEMTGLDPEFVKVSGGRIDTQAYLREVWREKEKLGSVYDSNVTSFDPFPFAAEQRANDPLLASMIAPLTTAMVDFVTRTVGWKVDARYNALSYDVNRLWDRGENLRKGSVPELRQAVAADPKLRVLDCARLERSFVPIHGFDSHGEPDAGHGRSNARRGARVSRRPHVLHARVRPPGSAQGCDGDVREALRDSGYWWSGLNGSLWTHRARLTRLDAELAQMVIEMLVHQYCPLIGFQRAEETVGVSCTAIGTRHHEPVDHGA